MQKSTLRALLALTLVLMVSIPVLGSAAVGNSGKITKDLTDEMLPGIQLNTRNLDVVFHEANVDETPMAELDATVVGIDSAEVSYGLDVTEMEGGAKIEAFHEKDKTVIGIDNVKLHIYLPKDAMEKLTVTMEEGTLSLGEFALSELDATAVGGKYDLTKSTIETLKLNGNDTEMNLEGSFTNVDINSVKRGVKLTSHTAPAMLKITATEGDVEVKVPEDSAFTVNYTVTDGKVSTNLVEEFAEESGSFTYGSGSAQYEFNVTNGSLKLNK